MSEHYDFHYQPTGSGAISGQQVLEQTEDAINELGDYVNDNVGGAMDVAQQALETAQNAEQDAQTALDTANSFSDAIQSAQQDASTALSTAQTAQTTATNANNTAIQAQQDANTAVTTANNASGQVSTLSGTVTALGQRVTTAEGNIGQNTSDITALTTRVGTAEGNITTLQNDVTIAQGNASSAMATAGQVKQQAFVFRYSSTALTASSTNSNTLLDNTDNLKVGDKVIDSSGVLFSITAIDTENSTFTIGTALIDLANDSDVVHKSGDETVGGQKTLVNLLPLKGEYLGSEASNNGRSLLYFLANRDTQNQSGIFLTKFRQNKAQGDMSGNDIAYLSFDCLENSVRTNNGLRINFLNFVDDIPQRFILWSGITERLLGAVGAPWSDVFTDQINGLNPSSLGMPDLDNGIDISSYITLNSDSSYTPLSNGYISICCYSSMACGLWVRDSNNCGVSTRSIGSVPTYNNLVSIYIPVVKNVSLSIFTPGCENILTAKFYPCQGNV